MFINYIEVKGEGRICWRKRDRVVGEGKKEEKKTLKKMDSNYDETTKNT